MKHTRCCKSQPTTTVLWAALFISLTIQRHFLSNLTSSLGLFFIYDYWFWQYTKLVASWVDNLVATRSTLALRPFLFKWLPCRMDRKMRNYWLVRQVSRIHFVRFQYIWGLLKRKRVFEETSKHRTFKTINNRTFKCFIHTTTMHKNLQIIIEKVHFEQLLYQVQLIVIVMFNSSYS